MPCNMGARTIFSAKQIVVLKIVRALGCTVTIFNATEIVPCNITFTEGRFRNPYIRIELKTL